MGKKKKRDHLYRYADGSKERNIFLQNRTLNTICCLSDTLFNKYSIIGSSTKIKRLDELLEKISLLKDLIQEEANEK